MTQQANEMDPDTWQAWSGVFSMSLGVALLIAIEFLPVSLLTPMAESLNATEGQTGQAVSISGLFAIATSLLVTTLAGSIDRKLVLLAMSITLAISLVIVAMAPNYIVLVMGRVFLGITVGGFWALATSVLMRLMPSDQVPKALSIMFTGQAAAAMFAAPLGSYFGDIIGWRGIFWILVPVVLFNLVWQFFALPALPARGKQDLGGLLELLKRPYFARGLIASIFTWGAAFTMFTYIRPFLEDVTRVEIELLSLLLLGIGVAGFVGTWISGMLVGKYVRRLLNVAPIIMALVTAGMMLFGQSVWIVAACLGIWGMMNNAISVIWMAWMSQNVDDAPEAAGSLMVAAIQGAILAGAVIGGLLLDHLSIFASFAGSVALSLIAVFVIGNGSKILNPKKQRS